MSLKVLIDFYPVLVSSGTVCRRARSHAGRRLFFLACLAIPIASAGMPANAQRDDAEANLREWQLRRLNQPTERELAQEREGRVYIYDGLTDRQIEQALDQQFWRIDHMMFVGTVKTDAWGEALKDENGKVQVESNGCSN